MTDPKDYPPPRHGIDPEVWSTFCAISDPANRHLFTKEAAYKAFQHVRVDGGSRVMQELTDTARELHKYGLMTKEELSHLILLSVTVPVDEAALMAKIAERYPRGDQSISLEEVISPECLAEFHARRKSRIGVGGISLQVATPDAVRTVMQRDVDAGTPASPDLSDDFKDA
ncbi:hypothetical protein os4_23230 [Comamonadaceae bacterium OS-4]|nr:hypothetical protein os4_23230 [Comamonadaceae bacterium OS-4]